VKIFEVLTVVMITILVSCGVIREYHTRLESSVSYTPSIMGFLGFGNLWCYEQNVMYQKLDVSSLGAK
jgi:hypothetical protein